MKIKEPPKVLSLYNEGIEYESSTKEVPISIRGKPHTFTIKPVGYFESARATTRRMKLFASMGRDDGYSEETIGDIKLDVVCSHTIEFEEITNEVARDYGAANRKEFVAKALGADGVEDLYAAIDTFGENKKQEYDEKIDREAEEIKN